MRGSDSRVPLMYPPTPSRRSRRAIALLFVLAFAAGIVYHRRTALADRFDVARIAHAERSTAIVLAAPLRVVAADAPDGMPGEVPVRFTAGSTPVQRALLVQDLGLAVEQRLDARGELLLLRAASADALTGALAQLERSPLVRVAERNVLYYASALPNDPQLLQQWALHTPGSSDPDDSDIDVAEVWDEFTGSTDIVIGVLDIDHRHEDLRDNLWRNPGEVAGNGVDAPEGDGDPLYTVNGHGTHVASIAAATGNNGIGIRGVAQRARIASCRFLDASGRGTLADALECLDYVARLRRAGAPIASSSRRRTGPPHRPLPARASAGRRSSNATLFSTRGATWA